MSNAIEVRNIGKRYKLRDAQTRYKNFTEIASHFISLPYHYFRQVIHKEAYVPRTETFWALEDINFDMEEGDVLGILGRNGSGKSTLLKILSRVTSPTRGRVRIVGRIGSLLEVGTGFHPELTGRENIFLNGIIIGMSRNEVKRKFDEIVEFSEISRFLDMPVKHYSSGMFMRLAFSVAVHLEPEILIIDEVLAVGDIDFQEKCLNKMKSYRDLGHSILFVSHNTQAIKELTNKAVLLDHGRQVDFGKTEDIVKNYIDNYSHKE
jgi:lipopolysaccharide transport system ATP-binding protein